MNRNNIKQAIQIASMTKDGNAYTKTDLYVSLLRAARTLSRLDTESYNGTIKEDDYTKKVDRIYKKLTEITKGAGIDYYHQGDPRGASLYISENTIDATNYTNGVAIY